MCCGSFSVQSYITSMVDSNLWLYKGWYYVVLKQVVNTF